MQSLALSAGSSASRWCSGNARREVIDTVPLPYAIVMHPHTDYLHRSENSVLALRVGERYGLRAFIHESHNLKKVRRSPRRGMKSPKGLRQASHKNERQSNPNKRPESARTARGFSNLKRPRPSPRVDAKPHEQTALNVRELFLVEV